MEIPVGEDTVESIAISIARLVEQNDLLQFAIRILVFGLEDVGDLGFRLVGIADDSGAVLLGGALVDEFAVLLDGLEGRVRQDVTGGCLARLGETKDRDSVLEEIEQSYVSRLDCSEEILCLFLR